MGVAISRDFVDAVRSAGDIVRLVSDYVPLRQAGVRLKGLCPFHQEKTPSFSVDPQAQLFYCFGCHTGGDVFKFVMLYEKVEFPEAVELLAHRWGVPLPMAERREDRARRRVLEINRAAESFFRAALSDTGRGREARAYLGRRGISAETSARLGLGYSPDTWEALGSHLASLRFEPKEQAAAGLAVPRKDGSHYDRFRGRLMFPIRDLAGNTVAFGGRTLGSDEPKYVNSPETAAYVKGDHLYGLDIARESIRREGYAVVVEGYLDLAALHQAGFGHAVASLGTAFTPAQARLLSRFSERVVVSYDGDTAGASATARSVDLLLERGFEVRVVDLPSGLDPDDFIRKEGAEAYGRLLRQAPGWLEYHLRREAASRDLTRIEEKVAGVNAVLPRLARLPSPIERGSWATAVAEAFGIEDDLVLHELKAALKAAKPSIRQRGSERAAPKEMEARLVSLLLDLDVGREKAAVYLDPADLEGTRVSRIVDAILALDRDGKPVDYPTVFGALAADEDRDLLAWIAFRDAPQSDVRDVEGCLNALRRERLVKERRDLQKAIERADDPAVVNALLQRKQQLGRQIDTLS